MNKGINIIFLFSTCISLMLIGFIPVIKNIPAPKHPQVNIADTAYVISLVNKASDFCRQNAFDSAALYYSKASQALKTIGSSKSCLKSLLNTAYCYSLTNKYQDIPAYIDTMDQISEGIINKYDPLITDIHYLKGIYYLNQSNYDAAIDYLKQALNVLLVYENSDNKEIANIYELLGTAYYYLPEFNKAKFDESIKYFNKSLENYLPDKKSTGMNCAGIYNNIGIVYHLLKDYENALVFYQKAISELLLQPYENQADIGNYQANIALVYLDKNDINAALKCINISTENHGRFYSDPEHTIYATNYFITGLINYEQDLFDPAMKYFKAALKIWEDNFRDYCRNIVICYSYIADIYTIKGKNKNEFKYFELEDDYRDSCYKWNPLEKSNFYVFHPYEHIHLLYGSRMLFNIDLLSKLLDGWIPDFARQPIFITGHYDNAGEYEKQYREYHSLFLSQTRLLGEQQHDIAKTYNERGLEYLKKNRYEDALVFFQNSLNIGIQSVEELYPALEKSRANYKNYEKALSYVQNKITAWHMKPGEDDAVIGRLYNDLGILYHKTGAYDSARIYFRKALDIRKSLYIDSHPTIAESYNNLGIINNKIGDYNEALRNFQKAGFIIGKKDGTVNTFISQIYNNQGIIYVKKEEFDKALKAFEKTLIIKSSHLKPDDPSIADTYNDLGAVYEMKGSYDSALMHYEKALEIRMHQLDKHALAVASSNANIAKIYGRMGKDDVALVYFKKAITFLNNQSDEEKFFIADKYLEIGRIYQRKNEFDNALQSFYKALYIRQRTPEKQNLTIADNYNAISDIYDQKKDFDSALKYEELALYLRRQYFGSKHYEIARSYNNLGNIYMHKRDYIKALHSYQEALIANVPDFNNKDPLQNPPSSNAYSHVYLSEILNNKARALLSVYERNTKANEYLEMALKTYDLTIAMLNKLNFEQRTMDARSKIETLRTKTYKEAIGFAAKTDKHKAFIYTELEKSGKLLSEIINNRIIRFAGVPDSVQHREKLITNDMSLLNKYIENEKQKQNPDFERINYWEKQLTYLKKKYHDLLDYIRVNHPDYYNFITTAEVLDIETIQSKHLSRDNALIEYKIADSLCYIFLTTKTDYEVFISEIDSTFFNNVYFMRSIMKNIDLGHHTKTDLDEYTLAANHLYITILKPLEKYIQNKRLIILTDEQLNYISFDALLTSIPAEGNHDYRNLPYLIREYPLSYSSLSATFLFKYYSGNNKISKNTILAFAPTYKLDEKNDSTDRFDLSPIPGAKEEVRRIADMIRSDIYEDNAATKKNFITHANDHNILHLAMHTLILDNKPMFSQLAFTPVSDSLENNFLTIYEIFNMKLNACMVVLSACNTGYGAMHKGEGVISLTGGFLYAGVPSIIMTLWSVEDKSSAELMEFFYYYLSKGKPKDIALQQAKIKYLHKANPLKVHPYFWAGFVNLGDPGAIAKTYLEMKYFLIISAVLFSILIFFILKKKKSRALF